MIRPSEIRVWSLIWPSRVSRGSVRAVSTASVRIDFLVFTTAPAAPRANDQATSEASAMLCISRADKATPDSSGSASLSCIGAILAGWESSPDSQRTQSATVGHVDVAALD